MKILGLFFTTFLFVSLANADFKQGFITVTGQCEKKITPNRVSFSTTIEELDLNQKRSSNLANRKYNKLLKSLKSINLDKSEFKTTQYNVLAENRWENRKQIFKGFKTVISFSTSTAEIKEIGKLLAKTLETKDVRVSTPRFYASKKLHSKHYNNCLRDAIDNARRKAEMIASQSNRQIKRIYDVLEGLRSHFSSIPYFRANEGLEASAMAENSRAAIEAGKHVVNANVTVTFSLKD